MQENTRGWLFGTPCICRIACYVGLCATCWLSIDYRVSEKSPNGYVVSYSGDDSLERVELHLLTNETRSITGEETG